MGLTFAKPKQINVLGLDGVGKTELIHKFQSDASKIESTIPVIGFNLEKTQHRGLSLYSWGIGGRSSIGPVQRFHMKECEGVVFVIDATDRDRVTAAASLLQYGSTVFWLNTILSEDLLLGRPLLIFANKQDLPNCMPESEIIECLGLNKISGRQWKLQPCSVVTGQGLEEGWNWIISQVGAAN
eukprot:TRINITY_DN13633_c0_g2_i6.p1 TRINITY_DN13633_c0_g2~~TRINITY_DN13633_c0_g2_i6.p1  ORF type:complete len:184 (-),score=15.94 TRINITY_DN13633_c0_g2_i6:382-933(-)